MGWQRYAVYWLPDGCLGKLGSEWLGWNARTGQAHDGAVADTGSPRRYGFHATLKPPFRLTPGRTEEALRAALRDLAADLPSVSLGHLRAQRLGSFLALVPEAQPMALAARTVEALDAFRAPAKAAELARRRATGLTPAQEALLDRWGYPYVMGEFRMHLTLSGSTPSRRTEAEVAARLAPALARPATLDCLSLAGEDSLGRFHLIADFPLQGTASDSATRAALTT